MLTDRGKLLLVAAAGLWVLGRAFAIPELSMAAVGCLALVGLAVLYTRLASARLAVRRHVHPIRLFHDAEGAVQLEIRNEGRLPTAVLVVEDEVPGAVADPARFVLEPLAPGTSGTVAYPTHGRLRGRYTVGPARVRLRDPFGIAQRPVRFGRTDELTVYPPVWALPPVLPRLGRQGLASEGVARPLSASGEFANVREYVRGDDLRKVHWRSTAHRGKLMIKQEEAPQETQATLVLDTRRSAHRGSGAASTFEHAVATTASAAFHLSERRYRLRLVSEPVGTPPPTVPWELVLEQLAVIQTQHGTTLTPVWQQLAAGAGGDGMLVAVVTIPDAAELRELVKAGRHFAARIAVLVAPPVQRGARGASEQAQGDAALAALRASGWRVTLHRTDGRLDHAWRELALRRTPTPTAVAAGNGRQPAGARP